MKKIFLYSILFTIIGLALFASSEIVYAVHVNGYYRSNGTYVNGYERTAPDSSPYNNYGYPGNYNPNTGKITGGNPDTYLNNYYNNSSGSTYSPSYSYPTIPTCPINSYYDGISSCKCNSGYVVSGGSCVSGNSVCYSQLGYSSSYDSLSNKCKCNYGYVIGTSGQCISTSSHCLNQLGSMSQYNSLTQKCECMSGYEFDGSSCVYKKTTYSYPSGYTASLNNCPINSYAVGTSCYCNAGYQSNSNKNGCELIPSTSIPVPLNGTSNTSSSFSPSSCVSSTSYPGYYFNGPYYYYDENCATRYIPPSPTTSNCYSSSFYRGSFFNGTNYYNDSNCTIPYNVITKTTPATQSQESVKSCDEGYTLSLHKTTCIKIPQNAHSADNGKDVWLCNDGYLEKGNFCVLKSLQSLTPTSSNNEAPKTEQKKSFWSKFKFW